MAPFTHVNTMHLVCDVYGTYVVGAALESDYGTITFLYLTFALAILITLISLGFVHIQMKYYHRLPNFITGRTASSSTQNGTPATTTDDSIHQLAQNILILGYTPILISWLVVLGLERNYIYPFPFVDINFPTLEFLPPMLVEYGFSIRLNTIPSAVLLLSKMAITAREHKRRSKRSGPSMTFTSHVAGLICGHMIHWDFPPEILLVPQFLIPGLLWVYLRFWKKVIPLRHQRALRSEETGQNGGIEEGNGARSWWNGNIMTRRSKGPYERVINRGDTNDNNEEMGETGYEETRIVQTTERILLPFILLCLICMTIYSLVGFDHGMAFSQLITTALFFHVVQSRSSKIATTTKAATTITKTPQQQSFDDNQYVTNENENFNSFGINDNVLKHDNINGSGRDGTPGTNSKENQLLILRSYFLACCILVRTDAMALGTWFVTNIFVTSDSLVHINFEEALFSLVVRMMINLAGLIVVSGILADEEGEEDMMSMLITEEEGKVVTIETQREYGDNRWTEVFGLVYRFASRVGLSVLSREWCLCSYFSHGSTCLANSAPTG